MKNLLLILCFFLAACHVEPKPKPKPTTSVLELVLGLGDNKEYKYPCEGPQYLDSLEKGSKWNKVEYYKKFNTLTLKGESYTSTHVLVPYVRLLTNKEKHRITQIGCPWSLDANFEYLNNNTPCLVSFKRGEPKLFDDAYTFFIYLKNKRYALCFYRQSEKSPFYLVRATERFIEGNLVKSKIWGKEDSYESIQRKITYPIKDLSFIPLLPSSNYETEIDSLSHFESDSIGLFDM